MGGMLGESKFEVLSKVPDGVRPKTILIKQGENFSDILLAVRSAGFSFPVIAKPDFGERGLMVRKINNAVDLGLYSEKYKYDFLIQDFIDLPLEFGVFYIRFPDKENGEVTSITGKEMLFVKGNGKSTLKDLILEKDRARLQWDVLKKKFESRLNDIIPSGEYVELVSVGNHCLGTTFLNRNDLISKKLSETFDRISKQIDGFYFGRFDLRTASEANLENGEFIVMELNGCGAEPSHIYHPGSSLWSAYSGLFRHWKDMYTVSRMNHRKGTPYLSFAEARNIYTEFKTRNTLQ